MKNNILIVTGGTGGHILPAINIFNELSKDRSVILIINKNAKNKFFNFLNYNPNKGRVIFSENISYSWKFLYIFLKTILLNFKYVYNSKYILSFSSLHTLPILFLSVLLRKKIYLQELDSVINRTNRVFLFFVDKILTNFFHTNDIPKKYNKKIYNIGVVINKLSIVDSKNVIFVMGATNGWEIFDKKISNILGNIKNYIIYHNCRKENLKYLENFYKNMGVKAIVSEYFKNYEYIISISRIIITRGGAYSLAYICAYNKNAIIIPWEKAVNNHQFINSKKVLDVNGGIVVEEKNINNISKYINYFLKNTSSIGGNMNKVFKVVDANKYVYEFLKLIER
ncbi:hypothetical protein AB836_01790 [Rickettsiales bacterium (ex Bugula neritina AB1)]|nr:hypothetical protein AB836_01790 [Rickettsiales bacterium (ex Bugula neritina AB1)]